MPTPQEIELCGPGPFPPHIGAPHIKKTRGRPRTKRIRKWYEALRRKMAKKDGQDPSNQARCCKLCRRACHDRRTCPEIARFRNNVVEESKMHGAGMEVSAQNRFGQQWRTLIFRPFARKSGHYRNNVIFHFFSA